MFLQLDKKKISLIFIYLFPIAYVVGPFVADLFITCIGLLYISCVYNKLSSVKFENYIICLFFFWIFIIFSSLINFNYGFDGFGRSITFFRFIILIIAIQYFIDSEEKLKTYVLIGLLTMTITGIDLLIQSISTYNIIGLRLQHLNPLNENIYLRPSGFFREELIAGSYFLYMSVVILIAIFHIVSVKKEFSKFYLLILLAPFFIVLAGERMSILYLVGIMFITLMFSFKLKNIKKIILRLKYIILFFVILSAIYFYFFAPNLINRFNFITNISLESCNPDYLCLFESAYSVFKENSLFGVGLKNFRHVCSEYGGVCSTHPHNLYFELISETGLVGLVLFLGFVILLLFKIIKLQNINFEYFYFGLILLFIVFWPLSTSRSFFSNYNACLIWFNIAMFIAIKKLSLKNFYVN